MTRSKQINTWMEYDEDDVSIRLHDAFEEIKQVTWDEKFMLTIGRDGDDLVITISRPAAAATPSMDEQVAPAGAHLVWQCKECRALLEEGSVYCDTCGADFPAPKEKRNPR
jgi:hypothetical protein